MFSDNDKNKLKAKDIKSTRKVKKNHLGKSLEKAIC